MENVYIFLGFFVLVIVGWFMILSGMAYGLSFAVYGWPAYGVAGGLAAIGVVLNYAAIEVLYLNLWKFSQDLTT